MTTRPPSLRPRWTSLLLVPALLLSATGCGGSAPEAPTRRAPLVEAVKTRAGALPLVERVHGVVRAENQVAVRPEISAPVEEIRVRSGDAVDRGEVLVRLRDDELRERLRRAEADVRLAEATAAEARAYVVELEARVQRTRALAAEELVSTLELETQEAQLAAARASAAAAEARVEQASATVDEQRSALEKTLVRAPVSGRVGERDAEIGMLVNSGTVLFRIGNLDRVIVEVPLTETMLSRVAVGDPVLIAPRDRKGTPLEADLTRISPFLRSESFTSEGEIDVDNAEGKLRPGMFVNVDILFGRSKEATLLPTSAVWEDPRSGERGVFVVEGGPSLVTPEKPTRENPEEAHKVRFRPVELLASGRGRVGVSGVEADEWVVIAGQHLLRRQMQEAGANGAQDVTEARIRPTTWERVTSLQDLQREDLLAGFLEKQRRVARALGAEIPESESVVEEILEEEPAEVAGTR